jgi:aryl-alcohol dehydrogenase-like predicted oxidoreductase
LRITGQPGNWGYPPDVEGAKRLLRRIPELGINFIDTADSYGPNVSESLIAEALHPYPDDLVIATKAGAIKVGPGLMRKDGRPEHLRAAVEGSLTRLRLEAIPLLQYHWIDPKVPLEESIGALATLRSEGKIRHIGICNVSLTQLRLAQTVTPIAAIQNPYSLATRASDPLVDSSAAEGIVFLPYTPLVGGALAQPGGPLDEAATRHHATPSQIALAWLLARSPNILVIPGTSSIEHLEENVRARDVMLSDDEFRQLVELTPGE